MDRWLKSQILKRIDAEIQVNRKQFLRKRPPQIPHIYMLLTPGSRSNTCLMSTVEPPCAQQDPKLGPYFTPVPKFIPTHKKTTRKKETINVLENNGRICVRIFELEKPL